MQLTLYQTLEDRNNPEEVEAKGPFACTRGNAWLGKGCYFWDADISVAHWWGESAYKGNAYMICVASAVLDDTCWDILAKETHRKELLIACQMIAADRKKPLNALKVSWVIEHLKKTGSMSYKAIRAATTDAKGYRTGNKTQKPRLHFVSGSTYFLDLQPPVQVCLFERRALSLRNYSVIYPDIYGSPYAKNRFFMKSELLEKLSHYLAHTPEEVKQKDWEAVMEMELDGPDVESFLRFQASFAFSCEATALPPTQVELPEHMTPDFSGSFFLRNIAA